MAVHGFYNTLTPSIEIPRASTGTLMASATVSRIELHSHVLYKHSLASTSTFAIYKRSPGPVHELLRPLQVLSAALTSNFLCFKSPLMASTVQYSRCPCHSHGLYTGTVKT
jgi:hypothetical protein